MNKRIIFDITVFFAIALLPWWLWLPGIFVGIVLFPLYLEGIIFAALADAVYGSGVGSFFLSFPFAAAALVLVVASVPVRERFRNS